VTSPAGQRGCSLQIKQVSEGGFDVFLLFGGEFAHAAGQRGLPRSPFATLPRSCNVRGGDDYALACDGPHHLATPEAYRGDRRKDAILQSHG
jgi:hypothetical protein